MAEIPSDPSPRLGGDAVGGDAVTVAQAMPQVPSDPSYGSGRGGETLSMIALLVLWVALFLSTFGRGPTDQTVLIGLWTAFMITSIASLVIFSQLLRSYRTNLLTIPSTWLVTSAFALFVVLLWIGFSAEPLSNVQIFLISAALLAVVVSLLTNIRGTHLVFGLVLTAVQLLFFVVIMAVALFALDAWIQHVRGVF